MNYSKEKIELLAPAGNMQKLKTALHFGADAVYASGKRFGLRAYADNFSDEELSAAVDYCKERGKKIYITINIFPDSNELPSIAAYGKYLQEIGVNGVIVSDLGIFSCLKESAPELELHVSTQANVTNSAAANAWAKLGAKRIVLARELTFEQIAKIRKDVPSDIELEAFVHGAMCIAYSGRCLLSSYFTGRGGNKGECAQSCRWEYGLYEPERKDILPIEEDGRGTYILSSKDLCMIEYLPKLLKSGVASFKIEGRMKSEYYVAGVVNAYRRAIDCVLDGKTVSDDIIAETLKISHRGYTTGFYSGEKGGVSGDNVLSSTHNFVAVVIGESDGFPVIEMRNKFAAGDVLEVLSPGDNHNKKIIIESMTNVSGERVDIADKVQQHLVLKTNVSLKIYDILRKPL